MSYVEAAAVFMAGLSAASALHIGHVLFDYNGENKTVVSMG